MMLSGENLFIAGPPDIIDEEETFAEADRERPGRPKSCWPRKMQYSTATSGLLLSVNTATGEIENEIKLGTLPTWDGMAGANGQLFLSTFAGTVICFGK